MAKTTFAILFACLLAIAAAPQAQAQAKLRMASDIWLPYVYGPDAKLKGCAMEILEAIYGPMGLSLDLKVGSWESALASIKTGEADVILGADRDEFPDGIFPKETIGKADCAFYVLKGNPWQYRGIPSLKNVRLGCVKGYDYHPEIDKYIADNADMPGGLIRRADSNAPNKENLELLLAGKIDVVIASRQSMEEAVADLKEARLQIAIASRMDEWDTDIFIAFSPKLANAKELAAAFDKGIRRMRKNGSLDQILSKYLMNDWKPANDFSGEQRTPKKAKSGAKAVQQ